MQNSTLSELSLDQLDAVAGGGASTEWGVATGVATAFVVGAATVASPVIAATLAGAAIYAAGAAIYYAASDEDQNAS